MRGLGMWGFSGRVGFDLGVCMCRGSAAGVNYKYNNGMSCNGALKAACMWLPMPVGAFYNMCCGTFFLSCFPRSLTTLRETHSAAPPTAIHCPSPTEGSSKTAELRAGCIAGDWQPRVQKPVGS